MAPLPQRNPVQVLLQDHLLGKVGIEPERPERLRHLTGQRARHRPEQAGELHRDGRRTRHHRTGPAIGQQRPAQRLGIHAGVAVEATVFRRDECDQQRGVHLRERNPLLQGPLPGAGGAERGARAVQEPERRRGRPVEERPRERQRNPRRHRRRHRQHRDARAPNQPAPSHGDLAFTVNTPPSVRPYTAGLYISSANTGGRTKTPGVVARAT